jgi:molybdopterin converting factor subunit 1
VEVKVLMFASLAAEVGVAELSLTLSDNATVGQAIDELAKRWPKIQSMRERLATAVNLEYAGSDQVLHEGDELALIPPVSGG